MKTFLKITLIFTLLSLLGIFTTYPRYKDTLQDKARVFLSKKISECTEYSIDIGKLDFTSLFSLNLSKVRIQQRNNKRPSFSNINSIKISCNLFSLLKDKQLETTMIIEGLEKNGMLADATIRTYSSSASDYKTIFSPMLLTDISIIDAHISSREFNLRKINGKININNLLISKANISFDIKGKTYLIKFRPSGNKIKGYRVSLFSNNINLDSTITKVNNDNFLIDRLTGTIYFLDLDLSGYIKGFTSQRINMELTGEVIADISRINKLPGKTGQKIQDLNISGVINSTVKFNTSDLFLNKYTLNAIATSRKINVAQVILSEAESKMSIKDGRVNIPSITANLCGGKVYGDAKLDIQDPNLPYILSISIDNMFLDKLIEDLSGTFSSVYGNTFLKLYLKGYAMDDASMEGTFELEVSNGDLGPMPLVSPLLGNIYSMLRNKIISPKNRVNIAQAYGEFDIKDRKISTRDASLLGENIAIIATGNVDFDGNLDFLIENKFIQTPIEEVENWQTSIRNTIIRVGKALGKAHLKGTISNPKWDFDYFL